MDTGKGVLLLLGILVGLTIGVMAGLGLYLVRPVTHDLSMETVDKLLMGLLLVAVFAFGVLTSWLLL
jgi:hypothetical protein